MNIHNSFHKKNPGKTLLTILIVIVSISTILLAFEKLTGLLTAKGRSGSAYDFDNCLYYASLSDEDKQIYEMFYDLVMHKDDRGYSRRLTMNRFDFATKQDELLSIYQAMLYDHPEFFFLEGAEGRDLDIRGIKTAFISALTFRLTPGRDDENEMISRLEKSADDFLADIDTSAPDHEIELQIHDKLIDTITYDYDILEQDLTQKDLGHTAYGALVADDAGRKNRAVCDGYAKAFQYLLQKSSVQAAVISGEADSESGTLSEQGTHAWNMVMLDGQWYEVDCCWDDINPPPEALDDPFYKIIKFQQPQYDNATHHWYNKTTEQMKHLPADPNTRIRIQQGSMFYELDNCGVSSHIRSSDFNLPIANGTEY